MPTQTPHGPPPTEGPRFGVWLWAPQWTPGHPRKSRLKRLTGSTLAFGAPTYPSPVKGWAHATGTGVASGRGLPPRRTVLPFPPRSCVAVTRPPGRGGAGHVTFGAQPAPLVSTPPPPSLGRLPRGVVKEFADGAPVGPEGDGTASPYRVSRKHSIIVTWCIGGFGPPRTWRRDRRGSRPRLSPRYPPPLARGGARLDGTASWRIGAPD